MPLTTLDPRTALIVIDLQKGLAAAVPAFALLVERSAALAAAYHARGLPVIFVTVDAVAPGRTEHPHHAGAFPPDFADLADGLAPERDDILITKRTWGAFASSDLEARLRSQGVTQVVITGIATSLGVESTARQAYEAGFHVTVVTDAVADPRPEAHENSLLRIFPMLGETGSTADVIALLEAR